MYEEIKNEILQEYYQKNYPNDGQRFIAWYLRKIFNLDPYETNDCITDGAGDKQIDAVYIDNRLQKIFILQGKFYSGKIDSEPLREVLSSWIMINKLDDLQNAANSKLKVKINEISNALEDDYEVCFELVTTGELTEAAQKDLENYQKILVTSLYLANIPMI